MVVAPLGLILEVKLDEQRTEQGKVLVDYRVVAHADLFRYAHP